MAITRTPIIDDDGSGTTGTVLDNAWKQELYGQIDAADNALKTSIGGAWVDIPYAAGNFSASGAMTFVVDPADVLTFAYSRSGTNTAFVQISIASATLGGTASSDCYAALPLTPTANCHGVGRCLLNGLYVPLLLYSLPGQARIGMTPLAGGVFNLMTNIATFQGTIIIRV